MEIDRVWSERGGETWTSRPEIGWLLSPSPQTGRRASASSRRYSSSNRLPASASAGMTDTRASTRRRQARSGVSPGRQRRHHLRSDASPAPTPSRPGRGESGRFRRTVTVTAGSDATPGVQARRGGSCSSQVPTPSLLVSALVRPSEKRRNTRSSRSLGIPGPSFRTSKTAESEHRLGHE